MKSMVPCILIGCCLAFGVTGETLPQTNKAVIDSMIYPIIHEAIDPLNLQNRAAIVRQDTQFSALDRYIRYCFRKHLTDVGACSVAHPDSMTGGFLIYLYIPEARIQYPERFARRFWGKSLIRRTARVELNLEICQFPENKIIFSQSYSMTHEDTFPYGMLSYVEQGVAIDRPDVPSVRGMWSWLEPFLLITSIGTVVYLFFAIRS